MASTTTRTTAQLAAQGGDKARLMPFPARSLIAEEEKAAVLALLEETIAAGVALGYNGAEENAYCQEFAAYMGGGYVDAVNSGSSGIYVALMALGLEPFGEVIVSSVTDPGGIMPIPLLNLIPMVADTEPNSYNSGPEQVADLITPLTRAVVIAHIGGEPANVEEIVTLAHDRGIPVIEDCSQSHGARLNGRLVGSFGDISVFSTMGGKHHCSGAQGGLVFTRSETLYQAIRRASDRGKPFYLPSGSTNAIAALNLNLNDLAAAIGRVQLRKLPDIVTRRQTIVGKLHEVIADLPTVAIPRLTLGAEASYWFLRMLFYSDRAICDQMTYCQALIAEGLPVTPHYRAALPHTMDWFVNRRVFGTSGYPWASPDYRGDRNRQFPCPNAHATMNAHFNLHIHENWGEGEIADAAVIFQKVDAAFRRR